MNKYLKAYYELSRAMMDGNSKIPQDTLLTAIESCAILSKEYENDDDSNRTRQETST